MENPQSISTKAAYLQVIMRELTPTELALVNVTIYGSAKHKKYYDMYHEGRFQDCWDYLMANRGEMTLDNVPEPAREMAKKAIADSIEMHSNKSDPPVLVTIDPYMDRIILAKKKHPDFFSAGVSDCCVQHDPGCNMLNNGACNCVPDITITSRSGKFSVDSNGDCQRLGAEGELIPTMIDPRQVDNGLEPTFELMPHDIEKVAFEGPETPDRGYTMRVSYLKPPASADALVEVMKDKVVVRMFLFPAYKIYNLQAHFGEIVDSEIEKNDNGYRQAAWCGIGPV